MAGAVAEVLAVADAAAAVAAADVVGEPFAVAELHIAERHVVAAGTGNVLAVAADIREVAARWLQVRTRVLRSSEYID